MKSSVFCLIILLLEIKPNEMINFRIPLLIGIELIL